MQLVGAVKFIHQDFARQLEKFILEVLNSEKLTKGLAGYILLDGKYVSIAETKTLLSVKKQLSEADTLFATDQWQPAMEQYEVSSSVKLEAGESIVVAIPRVFSNEPGADAETTVIVALTPRILETNASSAPNQ